MSLIVPHHSKRKKHATINQQLTPTVGGMLERRSGQGGALGGALSLCLGRNKWSSCNSLKKNRIREQQQRKQQDNNDKMTTSTTTTMATTTHDSNKLEMTGQDRMVSA